MIVLPDTKTFDSSIRLVQLVGGVTKVNMLKVCDKLDIKENQDENDSREIILNQVFYKLFKSQANYYLLGPNIERLIAPKLNEQKYQFIKTDYKTVVSEFHQIKNNALNKESKLLELCEGIAGQTLIYYLSSG